jgi:pimeloyl-ACP methyl ester carboxylesterase
MTARAAILLAAAAVLLHAGETEALRMRNKEQLVAVFQNPGTRANAVIFLPGDGGWRGLAITIAQTISSWGYDVYGFDTKRYLESFSEGGSSLTADQMQGDLRRLVDWVRARGAQHVTLLGWSQGAGMAILAARDPAPGLGGVITVGLPESAVLGWNWRDTIAVLARREPDEPHFAVQPLISALGAPLWMIHGGDDEYTSSTAARRLFDHARGPKRWVEIPGANHRADGKRPELFRALKEGLNWLSGAEP